MWKKKENFVNQLLVFIQNDIYLYILYNHILFYLSWCSIFELQVKSIEHL